MPATPLTAHECYLLERYTSLEYFGRLRDAWEATVHYAEGMLDRYMQHLPDAYRKRPLPKQPDIVWGERVLPNFRSTLQDLYDSYIKFSHGDWSAWGGDGVSGDVRGQREFWEGWMDEVEPAAAGKYSDLLYLASYLAGRINATRHGWIQGSLSFRYKPSPSDPWEPPSAWPRYRLNPTIRVASGEPVAHAGLYWPETPDAAVQFLVPTTPEQPWIAAPEASVGLSKSGGQYDHEEPTTWIKVERVPGETVEDGLMNLLDGQPTPPRNVPAGQPCPRGGWWFTPAKSGSHRYFNKGDAFPAIESSDYGTTFWQWSPDQGPPRL
ncbi:hypothetical protein AB7849_11910 [Rhodanobacter sp. 115]|uniref:hypothetical protein n=1 Tax=Rhodanobacter sp. FW021-MT20 TaxID=1162282 RepID=UPI000260F846|nr:hypothetical protein [Rhodanobacter sp. 115]EIM00093.1 hypothetical protein UU5_02427 [Rhodanobacter sp. 115]